MTICLVLMRVAAFFLVILAAWPSQGASAKATPSSPAAPRAADRGASSGYQGLRITRAMLVDGDTAANGPEFLASRNLSAWITLVMQPSPPGPEPDRPAGHSGPRDTHDAGSDVYADIVARLDDHLQFSRATSTPPPAAAPCGSPSEDFIADTIRRIARGHAPFYPSGPVYTSEAATAALAAFADCQRPSYIVLLADQILNHKVANEPANSVWVMSLVANSLSVLASMQLPLPASLMYSDVLVRKAMRSGVPLSALALKMLRNELMVPLLSEPGYQPITLRVCPAWRTSLHSISTLNHLHGYDAMLGFTVAMGRQLTAEVLRLPPGAQVPETSLERVARMVSGVLEWWRQPQARSVLATVPEEALWSAFVQRAAGDAHWQHGSPPALVALMTNDALERPAPVALRQVDIVCFAHAFKLALSRSGCLRGDSSGGGGPLYSLFTVTPGCPALRAYLRTPEGRTAYLKPHDGQGGATGLVVKFLAHATLLLRMVRDALLLATGRAALYTKIGLKRMLHINTANTEAALHDFGDHSLIQWISNSDPWTMFGTSVAAVLAVLRVIVRLSSALSGPGFSSAATQTALPAPPAADGPVDTAGGPAAAAGGRRATKRLRNGKKHLKGRAGRLPTAAGAPTGVGAVATGPAGGGARALGADASGAAGDSGAGGGPGKGPSCAPGTPPPLQRLLLPGARVFDPAAMRFREEGRFALGTTRGHGQPPSPGHARPGGLLGEPPTPFLASSLPRRPRDGAPWLGLADCHPEFAKRVRATLPPLVQLRRLAAYVPCTANHGSSSSSTSTTHTLASSATSATSSTARTSETLALRLIKLTVGMRGLGLESPREDGSLMSSAGDGKPGVPVAAGGADASATSTAALELESDDAASGNVDDGPEAERPAPSKAAAAGAQASGGEAGGKGAGAGDKEEGGDSGELILCQAAVEGNGSEAFGRGAATPATATPWWQQRGAIASMSVGADMFPVLPHRAEMPGFHSVL